MFRCPVEGGAVTGEEGGADGRGEAQAWSEGGGSHGGRDETGSSRPATR